MVSESLMGEGSIRRDLEALTLSQRLVRSLSHKLKRKNFRGDDEDECDEERGGVSLRCLPLYSRGGGCKVGAETNEEFGEGYAPLCGADETSIDCFSYGLRDKFSRRNNKKALEFRGSNYNYPKMNVFLPDDILEMCLIRLPLTSLMSARLVCKKWRNLTSTPHFMCLRRECMYQSPWIFLFGFVKNGYCSGEIHVLDVNLKQWYKLDSEAIKGRFLFSIASYRDDIYVVGGCSSLANDGKVDRSSFKTHKSVLVFSPLTRSWHKVASMKYARSSPILGICEIPSEYSIIRNQQSRQERRFPRSRVGGALDVYEDPHRLSVRRQLRRALDDNDFQLSPYKFVKQRNGHSSTKKGMNFLLIAVGGLGAWDEPLDSAEIYDHISNKWIEIQHLPLDFGTACSGVVCNKIFYVYSESDKLIGYDIERGYWVNIQTYNPPPRVHEYYPKLVCSKNRVFMVSVSWCEGDGEIGRRNKAVRKLWELDLLGLKWGDVSTHPDAPMDWNAGFVADKDLIFGVEMFKIFGQVLDFLTVCDVAESEMGWSHVSRNHGDSELDASSCVTKAMAVLHL